MSKTILKRIEKFEKRSFDSVSSRLRVAVCDVDGMYHFDDGRVLCTMEFKEVVEKLSDDEKTSLIVVHLDLSARDLAVKIENALSWSSQDLLEKYDFLFQQPFNQEQLPSTSEPESGR